MWKCLDCCSRGNLLYSSKSFASRQSLSVARIQFNNKVNIPLKVNTYYCLTSTIRAPFSCCRILHKLAKHGSCSSNDVEDTNIRGKIKNKLSPGVDEIVFKFPGTSVSAANLLNKLLFYYMPLSLQWEGHA